MPFPKHVDDYLKTYKLMSEIYPDIPKKLDVLVYEVTTWAIPKKEKKRVAVLKWLNKG